MGQLFKGGIFFVMILVGTVGNVAAAEQPDVIRHDAQYLDRTINFTIGWQSAYPVVKVKVSVGRETRDIPVDEYENRRNPQGYQGEVTLQMPVDPMHNQQAIPYVIQLEDDLRQKSPPVNGKAYIQAAGAHVREDNWGKENIRSGLGQGQGQQQGTSKAGDMIDKLIAVADRFDTAPSIDQIKAEILSPDNVSFSTKANDDKSLREIRFRVYDGRGLLVGFQAITNLGKVWQGSSQTFSIGGGTFRVVAQAIDSAGNTSPEKSLTFSMSGQPKELPVIQEPPFAAPAQPVSQPSPSLDPYPPPGPSSYDQQMQPQIMPPSPEQIPQSQPPPPPIPYPQSYGTDPYGQSGTTSAPPK